jgi:hypothetical protein
MSACLTRAGLFCGSGSNSFRSFGAPARYIGIGQASARPVAGERSELDRNQSDQTRYALTMWANAISQDQF